VALTPQVCAPRDKTRGQRCVKRGKSDETTRIRRPRGWRAELFPGSAEIRVGESSADQDHP
jgi:hypothetical protein